MSTASVCASVASSRAASSPSAASSRFQPRRSSGAGQCARAIRQSLTSLAGRRKAEKSSSGTSRPNPAQRASAVGGSMDSQERSCEPVRQQDVSRPQRIIAAAHCGDGERIVFVTSSVMRSRESCLQSGAQRSSAAHVSGSMAKPSCAAKRHARSIRSASSRKRRSGAPTQRRMPAARSARPP